jgi:hypothetical protein
MSENNTYTIKPIAWEWSDKGDMESWTAHTIFCTLTVSRNKWNDDESWSSWKFEYCRDEYYDEHSEEVSTAEEGKAKAEAWYLSTLAPALEVAK